MTTYSPTRWPFLPTTRLGRWAVAFGFAYIPLVLAWTLLPLGATAAFLCAAVGGVLGLIAVLRRGERAITVLLTVGPLLMVIAFLVGEVLVPH